jgi:surface antigen
MGMSELKIVAAVVCALTLAACVSDPNSGPNQTAGTAFGALAGGVAGASLGRSTSTRVAGAVAGATVGGIVGNAIGASFDQSLNERDRQQAFAAQNRALQYGEPGAPVGWRNPETNHRGTIVPGPAYQTGGATCREFSHTMYIDNKPQIVRSTACRNPDGSWSPVG